MGSAVRSLGRYGGHFLPAGSCLPCLQGCLKHRLAAQTQCPTLPRGCWAHMAAWGWPCLLAGLQVRGSPGAALLDILALDAPRRECAGGG